MRPGSPREGETPGELSASAAVERRSPRTWAAARLFGSGLAARGLSAILLAACLALLLGLEQVRGSDALGFTWTGVVGALASQLAVTGPAAILVALAAALNVLAGAILLRPVRAVPYRSASDLVLTGLAGAVLLDVAALFLLGSIGAFWWPELVILHALIFAAGWRVRPLLAGPFRPRFARPAAWWLLVLAVWAGPVILQLASPVVPFLDVLPNHVAPVEHVRAFGSFATLTTSPSPIYGPSRLFLGYTALLSMLTTLTGLHAALAIAAFALPLTILAGIAVHRLAGQLFGKGAGYWALLAFPLTFTFARLSDARATVLVFPLAGFALTLVALSCRESTNAPERGRRPDLALAAAFGAALLVHPLVGTLAVVTGLVMVALDPGRFARQVVSAAGGAVALALPQMATMLGIGLPSWLGLTAFPLAAAVAVGLARAVDRVRVPWRALAGALLVSFLIGLWLIAGTAVREAPATDVDLPLQFPLLIVAAGAGIVLSAGRMWRGWLVLGAALFVGVAAAAAVAALPADTLLERSLRYEVPKSLGYWTPSVLALGAAAGLVAIWRRRSVGAVRHASIAAFLVVALLPLGRPYVATIDIAEHRMAELLAGLLGEAERGYWIGYPDPRRIVDAAGQEVVDTLRAEEAAGRLAASSRVLHVAESFQQWAAVPIGVFTGALETTISTDPEQSIHTTGGRLYGLDRLDDELAAGYDYVVLEPAGLPADVRDRIVAAGYRQIFANCRAQIFVAGETRDLL